jgi:hypothetical protein
MYALNPSKFNKISLGVCLFILFSLLLAACNLPIVEQVTPTSQAAAMYTSAAQTVEARMTLGVVNTPITTIVPSTSAPSQLPVFTATLPLPTNTNQPSASPTPLCDIGSFVDDVTIPDNTNVDPGETFTKTWRIKNVGTCTWSTAYSIIFDHGNAMNAASAIPFPTQVAPGQTVDVSVNMTAPSTPGDYSGYWKLKNASGVIFGIGVNGDEPFFVKIKVVTGVFAVTSISPSVNPSTYNGNCSAAVLTFSASITTNGAGTIQYHWIFSDAPNGPVSSLTFNAAGSQTVSYPVTFNKTTGTYTGSGKIYIDEPNHQEFSAINYTLNCTP